MSAVIISKYYFTIVYAYIELYISKIIHYGLKLSWARNNKYISNARLKLRS